MYEPLIDSLLDSYNVDTLYEMLKATTLLDRPNKKPAKAQMIALMREKYFTRERILRSLDALTKHERAVLDRLLHEGGTAATHSFQRQMERAGLAEVLTTQQGSHTPTTSGSPFKPSSRVFRDLIARLTYHGLVFSLSEGVVQNITYKHNFDPGGAIYIPEFVRRHLPVPPPLPETTANFTPALVKSGDGQLFLRNLYLYWDFVRRTPVDLLQSGIVGKRSLKAINTVLLTPDPAMENASKEEETTFLFFLRSVLQSLNLLKVERNQLVAVEQATKGSEHFWAQSFLAQAVALVKVWSTFAMPVDIAVDCRRFAPQVQQARSRLLELLGTRRPVWQEPADWVELLQGKDRNFLFPRRTLAESNRGMYAFYDYGYYGDVKVLLGLLDKAEEQFVRFTMDQILFPFGLVELGYERTTSANWTAARLTERGVQVLKNLQANNSVALREVKTEYGVQSDQQKTENEGRVVVQPNFQVLAMGPVPITTLAFLDRFAERRKADPTVFEYYLTRQSVYEGLQRGLSVEEVQNFLRQTSGNDLPQNVQRSIHEWGAHHDRIVFRSGVTLLQAASSTLLDSLLNDKAVNPLIERGVTPEVALLSSDRLTKLKAALLNRNLLPAVSDDKPSAADHSILINNKGEIRPIHSVPNLHLTGRLARVAEPSPHGWRLTPASVRKAGGNRKRVEELLAELAKLYRGDLPPTLIADLKKWGLYYGTATIDTLTLIEFSDRHTLDELLKHPQLKDKLTPYKAGERAVATVESKQVKQVRQLLTELGVESKVGGGE